VAQFKTRGRLFLRIHYRNVELVVYVEAWAGKHDTSAAAATGVKMGKK
jgi:hypothetical protein